MSVGPIKYMGIGLQLAITILLGFFAGYALDRRCGTLPWLSVAGGFLGAGIGFYNLIVQLKNGNHS